jgi:hypothetical protein
VSNKPTVQLENAELFTHFNGLEYLKGNAVDHPRFPKGMYVYTSPVLAQKENDIETQNTNYKVLSWVKAKAA